MILTTMVITGASLSSAPNSEVDTLRSMVHELRDQVAELKQDDNAWINSKRADEIRGLVNDVLADVDTRASLQGSGATSGWPWVASADGNFKLKFGGQIQARWLTNEATGQEDQQGFEQRRTKLKFSGHVGDPSWQYKVTATWGRNDGSSTEDAYINKKFDNGSWFKFGQYKGGFLRENIVSSSKQLGVERSMLNNAFTYGWTQGIEYGWRDDDMGFIFQYNDGPGLANSQALAPSRSAMIARVEYKSGDASWKDFGYLTSKMGAKGGFMLGFSYQSMEIDDDSTSAEYGNVDANKSDGWSADASWRGDGWNVFAYMVETTGTTTDGADIDSSGWLVQAGYMINEHTEIFAKHQEGTIDGFNNDMSAFSAGFNYWPIAGNNAVKWTTDVSWAGDLIANGGDGASPDWVSSGNGWRADTGTADDQMLIRTQLQLLF